MKTARDIMTTPAETLAPTATLTEAAQQLRDLNVGSLPILDGDHLLGVVTDRDIVVRVARAAVLRSQDAPATPAKSGGLLGGLVGASSYDLVRYFERLPARARTIDEMPLEWFYGDGVVLDFRYKARGSLISAADVEAALDTLGYPLKPGDIVLIQPGNYNETMTINRPVTLRATRAGSATLGKP